MFRLLKWFILPNWKRYPWQFVLPSLALALGLTTVAAIDIGSKSTVKSFSETLIFLEADSSHRILPGTAELSAEYAHDLQRLECVESAAPVLEMMAMADEPLRLLGIDPLSEQGYRDLGHSILFEGPTPSALFREFLSQPGALLVSSSFLQRNDYAVGDSLRMEIGSRHAVGFVLAALPGQIDGKWIPDNLALCDLSTAQEFSGRGDVTSIDLRVRQKHRHRALKELRSVIPTGLSLEDIQDRFSHPLAMLGALRSHFRALSFMALLLSLFLLYNALVFISMKRRPQIAVLRHFGSRRRDIFLSGLLEAAIIGISGTGIGLLGAIIVGRHVLRLISHTASEVIVHVQPQNLEIDPGMLWKIGGIGLIATLLTAVVPILEMIRRPVLSPHPVHGARTDRSQWRLMALIAAILPLLIFALFVLRPLGASWSGYAAAGCLILATLLITPAAGSFLLSRARIFMRLPGGIITVLAMSNLQRHPDRSQMALVALTLALSIAIAMSSVVSSLQEEIGGWMGSQLQADIYIEPATTSLDPLHSRLDPALIQELQQREEIAQLSPRMDIEGQIRGVSCEIQGLDTTEFRNRAWPRMVEGPYPEIFQDRVRGGQAGISESMMRKTGLKTGDLFRLQCGNFDRSFRVAGIYQDFSHPNGQILLQQEIWQQCFGNHPPQAISIRLKEGASIESTIYNLRKDLQDRYALNIQDARSMGQAKMAGFIRSFQAAQLLQLLALIIAAMGVFTTLSSYLQDNRKEIAALRTLGLSPQQLDMVLLGEAAMISAIAGLMSIPAGSALAWTILKVINLRTLGWSVPFHMPFSSWGMVLGMAMMFTMLAGLLPLWQARKMSLGGALRGLEDA